MPLELPTSVLWSFVVTVLGGLLVLLIYDKLRRPPAASWTERRAELYEQIYALLCQIIEAQRPLSADEEAAEEYPEPQRLPYSERMRLVQEASTALNEIKALLKRDGFRLAPRAREIIDTLFRKMRDEDVLDTTRPDLIVLLLVQDALRDWEELLPAEIGGERATRWWLPRLSRWLDLQWFLLKQWVRERLWRLDQLVENLGFLTGPQLSQDDVRNPPRAETFKTVEEMKHRPRAEIQRELYFQLGADPPPWLPVPLAGRFHTPRDPESRKPSPRLHDRRKFGPLRTGDAADVCAHGVLLTEACRPCGFVVMPKDFAWGVDIPQEDALLRRGFTGWIEWKSRQRGNKP